MESEIDREVYRDRKQRIEAQIGEAKSNMSTGWHPELLTLEQWAQKVEKGFKRLTNEEKQKIVRAVVEEVRMENDDFNVKIKIGVGSPDNRGDDFDAPTAGSYGGVDARVGAL